MHPVFVAAVKRNQIGVAPSNAFLASTPPGTIPPTVRPPRIPELADAGVRCAGGASERRGAAAADGDCRHELVHARKRRPSRPTSSRACSRRSPRRPRPPKPSPPKRRATARSTAWRGSSASARTSPRPPKLRSPSPLPRQSPRSRLVHSERRDPSEARRSAGQDRRGPVSGACSCRVQPVPARASAAARSRRRSPRQQRRAERRGTGRAVRQLRQPLVGVPLTAANSLSKRRARARRFCWSACAGDESSGQVREP